MNSISNYINTILLNTKRVACNFGLGNHPDFLIIGAQKAGTTSLFNYINEYAQNFISPKTKELYFFSENYNKGIPWYKAHFPLKTKNGYLTGEATPDYLYYHKCAKRIHENYPDLKIIVLLRNPIDRAYSQYNFQRNSNKTKAYNPLSFEEAIKDEQTQTITEEFTYNYKYRSYLKRGHYYEQLKKWLEYYPEEQFMFIESEDFYNNTESYLGEVFNFLGLKFKKDINLNLKAQNKTVYSKRIKSDTRAYLRNYFRPHNEKLYSLLQRDFKWD